MDAWPQWFVTAEADTCDLATQHEAPSDIMSKKRVTQTQHTYSTGVHELVLVVEPAPMS